MLKHYQHQRFLKDKIMEVYLSDNKGSRMPPHVGMAAVEAASAQKLTNGTKDTDGTVTVESGARYVFTAQVVGGFYLGILDVTTDANKLWCCPIYQSIIFRVPIGTVTLHYATDTNSGVGYLRKLADN
jgi:hypothetical protein